MTTAEEESVRAADMGVDQAAVAADKAGLEALLASDFLMTHASGGNESRESWINNAVAEETGYLKREHSDHTVEVHGDVAITTAKIDVEWKSGRSARLQYVRILRKGPDGWQLIAHKPTRRAE
jgi:ketosteroid isomerase-like protein